MCLVASAKLHQQIAAQFLATGSEGLISLAVQQLERFFCLVLRSQNACQTLTSQLVQRLVGGLVDHGAKLASRFVQPPRLDRHLRHEQAAVLRIMRAGEIFLQQIAQSRNFRRIGFTFFPTPEGQVLYANATFVAGTPREHTAAYLAAMEARFAALLEAGLWVTRRNSIRAALGGGA